ncbi:MAG: hypothetical protein J6M18_01545 [Actinomycetaceae bacterium]|nr:hypothetical protein [Actinomycetaceae bacterium]
MSEKTAQEHYEDIVGLSGPLPVTNVDTPQAVGLVLGNDIYTPTPLPPFTRTLTDGFAVRSTDVTPGQPLHVMADMRSTNDEGPTLSPHTCIRVAAQSHLPIGADTVLPESKTLEKDILHSTTPEAITPTEKVTLGQYVKGEGEELAAHSLLFRAGTQLTSAHTAALQSLGFNSLQVHRRPRIAIISTHSDISPHKTLLTKGTVPDSGYQLVEGFLRENNVLTTPVNSAGFTPQTINELLLSCSDSVDAIITTGHTSSLVYKSVQNGYITEGISFDTIAMSPAKAQGYGHIVLQSPSTSGTYGFETVPSKTIPILCLPGTLLSTYVSLYMFVLPLIDSLKGKPTRAYKTLFHEETVGTSWAHKPGREQYIPCIRMPDGSIVPSGSQSAGSSHYLVTVPNATGLARIPADAGNIQRGMKVDVLWTNSPMGF